MRDITGYVVLIFFCFTFYFLCFLTLQQQIKQRDTDLTQLLCNSLDKIRTSRQDERTEEEFLPDSDNHELKHSPAQREPRSDIVQDSIGSKNVTGSNTNISTEIRTAIRFRNRLWKRPICPRNPPGLEGIFNSNVGEVKPVKYGGTYRPEKCLAEERVAIIVPYRDRREHLDIFLPYMHKFLQKQQLEYTIFVVEMALPTQFNRGLLANAGFINAASTKKYTCFIFHDVDLLPANGTNMYTCGRGRKPRHMSVRNSKFGYKLPYEDYFGGIVSFSERQFARINGFSNMYFGWGAEDDDLRRRLEYFNWTYERQKPEIGYYKALSHDSDASNPHNPVGDILLRKSHDRIPVDGLNSVRYTRLAVEFRDLYTWIYIRANETQYMNSFTYLQSPPMRISVGTPKNVIGGHRLAVPFVL